MELIYTMMTKNSLNIKIIIVDPIEYVKGLTILIYLWDDQNFKIRFRLLKF